MSTLPDSSTTNTVNNTKKFYCPPQLIEYGSMAELTLTTTSGSNWDGSRAVPNTLTTGPGV